MLAAEALQRGKANVSKGDEKDHVKMYTDYLKMAEIYQAYHHVNKYLEESYGAMVQGSMFNESIFNAARFLVNNMPAGTNP